VLTRCLVQDAIDWLGNNQDRSLDDIKAEIAADEEESAGPKVTTAATDTGEEARSLVCNDCGKKFTTHSQAEFHASKTYVPLPLTLHQKAPLANQSSEHTNFSESTEAVVPLTEAEKAARLAELRERLAAKRAEQGTSAKDEAKRNEEIRRRATRESHDARDAVAARETAKDAERKRREKKEDELVRKRILDQIARDKQDRARKAEMDKAVRRGEALPAAEPASEESAAVSPKKMPAADAPKAGPPVYAETRLRLQAPSATVMKSFPVETTLFEVAAAVAEEVGFEVSSFTTNFPKKTFSATEFGMTLKEAGMVPSAALILK
jgi:UBX domain-containing protein 1/4